MNKKSNGLVSIDMFIGILQKWWCGFQSYSYAERTVLQGIVSRCHVIGNNDCIFVWSVFPCMWMSMWCSVFPFRIDRIWTGFISQAFLYWKSLDANALDRVAVSARYAHAAGRSALSSSLPVVASSHWHDPPDGVDRQERNTGVVAPDEVTGQVTVDDHREHTRHGRRA